MSNETPEAPKTETPAEPKEKTLRDRLSEALYAKLGNRFQVPITLTSRGDVLSWLVHLAEIGLEAQRKEWWAESKAKGRSHLDASQVASLGSWRMDLEQFVDSVIKGLEKAKK